MKVLLFATLASLVACGGGSKGGKEGKASDSSVQSSGELVSISVGVAEQGLSLAASASAFSVSIDGCVSGLTGSVTEASPSIDLYKGDSSCRGKLVSFTVGGQAFSATNPNATPFAAYTVGSKAVFTNAAGTSKMDVSITQQLSSPLVASDAVSFSFMTLTKGSGSVIASNALGQPHAVTVGGDKAPDFRIDAVDFQGLNPDGSGRFVFTLECLSTIVTGASASCSSLLFTDLSYVLVEDTYSGAPTVAQLASMFPGMAVVGANVTSSTSGGKGGFITSALNGPQAIATHSAMLLVIKNGGSYLYFTVAAQSL